jgi:3-carboxy-cis,cis-muconate cycloisomerase
VAEVREGGEGGASSTMPQKRNPTGAVATRACAALARAGAVVLTGALPQEHERAAGAWHAEWEALCAALAYTGAAASALASALEELEVDAVRMRANLELTGGQIAAERLALILTDTIGRTEARELVRAASLRTAASGRSLADELLAEDTGLTAEEVAAALDPATYLGSAGAFVDRALALFEAERGA